ncbi:hypothetical protein HK405_001611, partial [Cladochytrium tenue]
MPNAEALWSDPKLEDAFRSECPEKTRLLKLVRTGIPHHMRGRIYSKILKVDKMEAHDKDFEQALRRTHGAVVPTEPLAPTFGGRAHRSTLALTRAGARAADHILCVVAHDFPALALAPPLPVLAHLLCHVMDSPDDALGAVVALAKQATRRTAATGSGGCAWRYFPTHARGVRAQQRAFSALVARHGGGRLARHLATLQGGGGGEPAWSGGWLADMFVGALPQPAVWRALDSFVVEGPRALFRLGAALVAASRTALLACRSLDAAVDAMLGPGAAAAAAAGVSPAAAAAGGSIDAAWPLPVPFEKLFAAAWVVRLPAGAACDGSDGEPGGGVGGRRSRTTSAGSTVSAGGDDDGDDNDVDGGGGAALLRFQRATPKLKAAPTASVAGAGASGEEAATATAVPGVQPNVASSAATGSSALALASMESGRIVQDEQWIALWSWIPASLRVAELERVFATREHGHHISTLFARTSGRRPMLLVAEATDGAVFGAFLSDRWPECDAERGLFYGT